jgi:hypothetical protein
MLQYLTGLSIMMVCQGLCTPDTQRFASHMRLRNRPGVERQHFTLQVQSR